MDIEKRLKELGFELPRAPKPVAVYVPSVSVGDFVFISGQLPFKDGELMACGPVPTEVSVEDAQRAAAQCVLNALAVIINDLDGDWSRFVRVVRIGGFVQSENGFADQPKVINGASELLVDLFGDAGRHARAAVGTNALPLNASVEVEMIIEVD